MEHEQLGGGSEMQPIDVKLAAIEHREGTEARHELIEALQVDNPVVARAFYSAFSSLVEAGFDEEQAMSLIIARGWHLAEGC